MQLVLFPLPFAPLLKLSKRCLFLMSLPFNINDFSRDRIQSIFRHMRFLVNLQHCKKPLNLFQQVSFNPEYTIGSE
jgi:hypothetical protein